MKLLTRDFFNQRDFWKYLAICSLFYLVLMTYKTASLNAAIHKYDYEYALLRDQSEQYRQESGFYFRLFHEQMAKDHPKHPSPEYAVSGLPITSVP